MSMKVINGDHGAIAVMGAKEFNDTFHHTGEMPHCNAQWVHGGIVIIPWDDFENLIKHLSVDEAEKLYKDSVLGAGEIKDHWAYGPNRGKVYSEIALKGIIATVIFTELEQQV